MVKNVLERLYIGKCDIIQQQSVIDPVTHITSMTDVVVVKGQPCRLSYKTITAANQGNVALVVQVIKLFMSPTVKVLAGSKIIVTQNGQIKKFEASGEPAVYSSHQEIILRLADDKA